jgi:hypothetical protein
MSVVYLSIDADFESCTSLRAKIVKIDAIIDSLLTTALKSVGKGDKVEYMLDTGQSKQKVVYSSITSVTAAIREYEDIRQMYEDKLNGSLNSEYRNVDQRNLRRRNYE